MALWLTPALAAVAFGAAVVRDPPATALHVFADVRHDGTFAGPLKTGKPAAGEFCVCVPVPPDLGHPGQYADRLARIRVEGVPESVQVTPRGIEAGQFRLWRRAGDGWERQTPDADGSYSVRPAGGSTVEVALAVVIPTPEATDGKARPPISFSVEVGTATADGNAIKIPFRVAPFLIPSSLEPVGEVLVVEKPQTAATVAALTALAPKVGFKLTRHKSEGRADVWMQDSIEPGVFCFPSADGPRQVDAALTGTRKEFGWGAGELDVEARDRLRERGFVTVAPGSPRKNTKWIDWYGNLEVTPPHTDRAGRRFPYGRVLTGRQRKLDMHPGVIAFLEAQGLQWPPVVIDTSWLFIGHVDEVVNFAPAKTAAGFRVLLPSPKAARAVLDDAANRGLGETVVFAGSPAETTVGKLRESVANSKENVQIDEHVAAVEKQLAAELNLGEADFVRLPVLFDRGIAVIPNAVNSLVANGHVLVPDPRGPQHEGKDLFAEAIKSALRDCDVQVSFVDVWRGYHSLGGELHCGTNTVRRLREPAWWKHVR